jgi:ABC-type branched-subunit amino acid transport system substrate-binding protein
LDEFGISIPVIGAINTALELSDSAKYPNFMRTIVPDTFNAKAIPSMFGKFEWRQCAVIYEDTFWGRSTYHAFADEAERVHINILNAEEDRSFPSAILREKWHQYLPKLKAIIDSKAGIVVIILSGTNRILALEGLYDLGVRRDWNMILWGIQLWKTDFAA